MHGKYYLKIFTPSCCTNLNPACLLCSHVQFTQQVPRICPQYMFQIKAHINNSTGFRNITFIYFGQRRTSSEKLPTSITKTHDNLHLLKCVLLFVGRYLLSLLKAGKMLSDASSGKKWGGEYWVASLILSGTKRSNFYQALTPRWKRKGLHSVMSQTSHCCHIGFKFA